MGNDFSTQPISEEKYLNIKFKFYNEKVYTKFFNNNKNLTETPKEYKTESFFMIQFQQ